MTPYVSIPHHRLNHDHCHADNVNFAPISTKHKADGGNLKYHKQAKMAAVTLFVYILSSHVSQAKTS